MISTFFLPTTVLCGEGSLEVLPRELASRGVARPLLVTGPNVLRGAVFQRIRKLLPQAEVFNEVAGPTEKGILDGAELFVSSGCDGIVALGGGTVLDAGKAIRLKIHHPRPLAEYAVHPATADMPVLAAVPTTGGSGSELSAAAMIVIEEESRRIRISSPHLMPSVAIIDPELTLDLSPAISASSGLTAFVHCIEAFLLPGYHPLCDALAAQGARLASEALPRVLANGRDIEARRDMMLAALTGAIASQKGSGIAEVMANAVAAPGRLSHGAAAGVLLTEVLDIPELWPQERLTKLAQLTGISSTAHAARDLLARTGIAPRLRDHGIDGGRLPEYARAAFEDLSTGGEPRSTEADLLAIYRRAW